MKYGYLMTAVCAALIAASPAMAQDGPPPGEGHHKGGARMMEKFDTDKDGKISKAEFDAMHDEKFKKMDANGDGFITKEEGKAAHEEMRKKWAEKRKTWSEKGKEDGAPEGGPDAPPPQE